MRFLVYLAGPITGLDYDGCTEWRERVLQQLPPEISGLSPMRAKGYLRTAGELSGTYDQWPLATQQGIYARDMFDCTRSDAILVNMLGATTVSIGTVMEIAWASNNQVPVILIMEEGNIHEHAMIRQACPFVVNNLDDGIQLLSDILLPSKHN